MIAQEKMKEAINIGICELLLQPEYGEGFVREILNGLGEKDVSDDDVEEFSYELDKQLAVVASTIVEKLTDKNHLDLYRSIVVRRQEEIEEDERLNRG